MKKLIKVPALLVLSISMLAVIFQSCNKPSYEKTADGIIVHMGKTIEYPHQTVRLQVISDKIIHVTSVPLKAFPEVKSSDGCAPKRQGCRFHR